MRHLRIEQNNIQENVSSSVIAKLYNESQNNLDNTSNLQGNLHTTATYQEYINFLTQKFPDLYINADKYYIMFADLEVQRILVNAIGDGIGVTEQVANEITTFGSIFVNNTNITQFNELSKFKNLELPQDSFTGCTNLVNVNLPSGCNFTGNQSNKGAFRECTSLSHVGNLSKVPFLGYCTFYGCTSLGENEILELNFNTGHIGFKAFHYTRYKEVIIHSSGKISSEGNFQNMPDLKKIDYSDCVMQNVAADDYYYSNNLETVIFPNTTGNTSLSWRFLCNDVKGLNKIILLSTTVPGIDSISNWNFNRTWCFYVPDEALSNYQQANIWNTFTDRIKPLSSSDLDNVTWYTKEHSTT